MVRLFMMLPRNLGLPAEGPSKLRSANQTRHEPARSPVILSPLLRVHHGLSRHLEHKSRKLIQYATALSLVVGHLCRVLKAT